MDAKLVETLMILGLYFLGLGVIAIRCCWDDMFEGD